MDAKAGFFVVGSDVKAGMGAEVVPFSKKEDAEKFSSEHKGKRVAAYADSYCWTTVKSHEKDVEDGAWHGRMEHGMKHGRNEALGATPCHTVGRLFRGNFPASGLNTETYRHILKP